LPIDVQVAVTPAARPHPLGDYLGAAAQGAIQAPAVIAVPVEAPGAVPGAGAADLDAYLGAGAAEVIAASELTGRAGEASQSVAGLGSGVSRVAFLGVGLYGRGRVVWCRASPRLASPLDRGEQAVADRQERGHQALVHPDLLTQVSDRGGVRIVTRRVGHLATPERVVEDHHPPGSQ
jgi:hypothetical protein